MPIPKINREILDALEDPQHALHQIHQRLLEMLHAIVSELSGNIPPCILLDPFCNITLCVLLYLRCSLALFILWTSQWLGFY